MLTINIILALSLIVVGGGVYNYIIKTSDQISTLKKNIEDLEQSLSGNELGSLELKTKLQAPDLSLAIQLLDPLALAKEHSKVAGIAGSIAPNLVKGEVYKKAQAIVSSTLMERGIAAKVSVIVRDWGLGVRG